LRYEVLCRFDETLEAVGLIPLKLLAQKSDTLKVAARLEDVGA
jgi:hypothetical protein